MYDVIIIGGGPAGATLARLIGEKMQVLLLDRRQLDRPPASGFEKCCGGLLAPDAQEMLAKFGMGLPKEVLVGPQLFTVRTIDFVTGRERYYPRNYVNLDRELFDRWLVSLVPSQVDACWGAQYKGFVRTGNRLQITYLLNGQVLNAQARLLVGADGAFSRVRAGLGHKGPGPDLYVAVQEWFKVQEAHPYYSAIFDPEVTDFYAWTIPKEDMLLVGAAIPSGQDVTARFALLKQKLSERGYDLSQSLKKRGIHLFRPSSPGQICTGHEDIALIGEAAGWISPSSAEGISYAFRSALALARSLEPGISGAVSRYHRQTRGLRTNVLGKIIKSPAMYWPFLRRMAMGSGLLALDVSAGGRSAKQ